MKKSMKISGLVLSLLLASGWADAAGLGRMSVQSSLGQPLRAEIELLSVTKEELAGITAKLAAGETFRQARIERLEALNGFQFAVDQRPNGQPIVRITSSAPVAEPFLDLLIELNWNTGRIIREYTILLDPPSDAKAGAAPAQPALPVASMHAVTAKPAAPNPVPAEPTPEPAKPAVKPAPPPEPVQAAASAPAKPMRYGPVRTGETLRAIAGKVKPESLSIEQVMVGLYQSNQGAFQGNMNRLRKGVLLNMPAAGELAELSPAAARRAIHGHDVEWHAYQRKVSERAAEAVEAKADQPAAEGRIAAKSEPAAAPAPAASRDVLKLSKGEPGGAAKPDAKTLEKLTTLEEELASKARALQEAQERVNQLERTVQDMQKLLELKSKQAAQPAPAPAPAPQAPARTEMPKPVPVAAPKPAPAPMVLPPPLAEEQSWLATFLGNPVYIGGLVAAVLLSGLLWMMMMGNRRRQGLNKFEDSILTGGDFKNSAMFNTGMAAETGSSTEGSMLLTDFSRLGLGAIDSQEVDPIAEAEVYMAYGRDAQAEEILKEALAKDPNRHEIALKLLEIYAARKDPLVFETTASELYAALGGQATPVWLRAAELGRSIDPDNPLYRAAQVENTAAELETAVMADLPSFERQASAAPMAAVPLPDDFDTADDWAAPQSLASEPEAEPEADAALEFQGLPELQAPDAALSSDWDEPSGQEAAAPDEAVFDLTEPAREEVVAPAAADEPFSLDFEPDAFAPLPEPEAPAIPEFDLSDLEPMPEAGEPEPLASFDFAPVQAPVPEPSQDFEATEFAPLPEAEPEVANTLPALDLSGIDMELETPGPESAEAPEELAFPASAFDFDVTEVPAAETALEGPAAEDVPEFGMEELTLDAVPEFDLPADAAPAQSAEPEPAAMADLEPAAPAPAEPPAQTGINPALWEEVNTKLDLARAYLEMGDKEGAREILQEVVGEGDEAQKSDAEQLLAEAG